MIVIDPSLPYPDYVQVLDSEKYKVAKENYDWFIRDPEGYRATRTDKSKDKDLGKSLLKAIEDVLTEALLLFKTTNRTCIDLNSYVSILEKALEVGAEVTQLGIDGDDLSKQFIELTLKQTLHLDNLLRGDLQDLSDHLPVFLNVLDMLLTRTNAPIADLLSAYREVSAYSAKHLNTKSECAGESSFDYVVQGISGAMSKIPAQTGAKNGGKLRVYPELTWLLSYRFKALNRDWIVKDFLGNSTTEQLVGYGCPVDSVIVRLSEAIKSIESRESTLSSTTQLKFIQLSVDHGETFESLLVIPSTSYLEVISELVRVNNEVVYELNANNTDSSPSALKKPPAYHKVGYVRIDASSDKPQNVSALYQELYGRSGLPRFNNILYTKASNPELNKLYVIDSWFKSRTLSNKEDALLNSKFSNMENLLPVLPNRAKSSIKESTIAVATKALLAHLNTQLSHLKSNEAISRIKQDGHKMDSDMGLLKLIAGEQLTDCEAIALAECLTNKLLSCPKSMKADIIKTLTEYLL